MRHIPGAAAANVHAVVLRGGIYLHPAAGTVRSPVPPPSGPGRVGGSAGGCAEEGAAVPPRLLHQLGPLAFVVAAAGGRARVVGGGDALDEVPEAAGARRGAWVGSQGDVDDMAGADAGGQARSTGA